MKINEKYELSDYRRYGNNPKAPYTFAQLATAAMQVEDLEKLKLNIDAIIEHKKQKSN